MYYGEWFLILGFTFYITYFTFIFPTLHFTFYIYISDFTFYIYISYLTFFFLFLQKNVTLYGTHPYNTNLTMSEYEYNQAVTLYADGVYRFILKNIQHINDAEDVVQTTYEKLWINRDTVETATSKAYIFTIAYNTMIDYMRKSKKVIYTAEIDTNAMITNQPNTQLKKALDEALQKLNETQRSLILLKDYEGYTYAEIGQIMDLNESQVKVYLHRARMILRDYIVKMENVN